MNDIKGIENSKIFMYSFWASLAWMFVGPVLFLIPLIFWLATKDPNFVFTPEYIMGPQFLKASMVTELLGDILPFALIAVFLRKMLVREALDFKQNWLKYLLVIIASFASIYVLSYLLTELYELLGIKGSSQNQSLIEDAVKSEVRPIMFVMVVITGPIMEEFIFRKFLIGYLEEHKKLKPVISFLISSVSFAAIHVILSPGDMIFLPQYLVLACVITFSYQWTKNNIYVSSIVHILNNLWAFFSI